MWDFQNKKQQTSTNEISHFNNDKKKIGTSGS